MTIYDDFAVPKRRVCEPAELLRALAARTFVAPRDRGHNPHLALRITLSAIPP